MIISHKHKFIFVKTAKTAGTSIEIALSKYCGQEDVITPISRKDEELRANLGFTSSQNYEESLLKYGAKDWYKRAFYGEKKKKFYNHIPASKVISLIGKDVWEDYLTFCFERNPWDKVVSWYWWKGGDDEFGSFSEFIKAEDFSDLRGKGFYSYTSEGRVLVDKVCKYENLEKDLVGILEKVGIKDAVDLPFTKAHFRNRGKKYCDLYSIDEKNKVKAIFEKEINLLDYSF